MKKTSKKEKNTFKKSQEEPSFQVEIFENNTKFNPNLKKAKFLKWVLTFLIINLILVIFTFGLVGWYLYNFINKFSQASQTNIQVLINDIQTGWNAQPIQDDNLINVLILGIDEVSGRNEGVLTDTIILASWDLSSSRLKLLSLPRDLWIDAYKTKINALYYYGEIDPNTNGKSFTSEVVEEILDIDIHHVVTLNLETIGELIDILGGVEINVATAFIDDQFPVSGIDISSISDPAILYETISFEKGLQTMDGNTALKFIRSRHSIDLSEGTDTARGARQHQLINAVIKKTLHKSTLTDPTKLGQIYKWYQNHFGLTSLNTQELVSISKYSNKKLPQIDSFNIPIANDENSGLLINPEIQKYKQWVYEPVDPSWQQVKEFVRENLNSKQD